MILGFPLYPTAHFIFSHLFILSLFSLFCLCLSLPPPPPASPVCLCARARTSVLCRHPHTTAFMWRSKDSFQEFVVSFPMRLNSVFFRSPPPFPYLQDWGSSLFLQVCGNLTSFMICQSPIYLGNSFTTVYLPHKDLYSGTSWAPKCLAGTHWVDGSAGR